MSELQIAIRGCVESIGDPLMEHIEKHVNTLHPGKYSRPQISEEVRGMVRREELRMKEDCIDHDWAYRKGRMW